MNLKRCFFFYSSHSVFFSGFTEENGGKDICVMSQFGSSFGGEKDKDKMGGHQIPPGRTGGRLSFFFSKNVPEMKVKRTAKEGKTIEDGSKNITMKHNPMAEIILKSSH